MYTHILYCVYIYIYIHTFNWDHTGQPLPELQTFIESKPSDATSVREGRQGKARRCTGQSRDGSQAEGGLEGPTTRTSARGTARKGFTWEASMSVCPCGDPWGAPLR